MCAALGIQVCANGDPDMMFKGVFTQNKGVLVVTVALRLIKALGLFSFARFYDFCGGPPIFHKAITTRLLLFSFAISKALVFDVLYYNMVTY
jgi:hypothetical protein